MRNRRDFLKAAVGTSVAMLAAACSQPTPAAPTTAPAAKPTTASKPTVAPAAAKPSPSPAAARPSSSPSVVAAADPRAATVKVATLEQELALPPAILEAAQKEGTFRFISTIDKKVADKVLETFTKRYPGITGEYQEASEEVRTVRTLTEFKARRNQQDVVMGVGGFMAEYKAAKAVTPLNDLPAYANYESPYRDNEHEWVGTRTQFWGIGYNSERVKKEDLPKSWEDLGDPKWRGRIGLGDRPNLWVQQIWKVWGPERTTAMLKKLFANSPQRRKEGLGAAANLLAAGEYDLLVPGAPYRIQGLVEKQAKVGWFSPEPLPVAASELVIITNAPHPNAAKVFVNWFVSREGQATYSKLDDAAPTHPALRNEREYLGMFVDEILRTQWSMRLPEDEETVLPKVREVWAPLWGG